MKFNTGVEKSFLELTSNLMRDENSPFSIGERELIGAYVSGINACNYCYNGHAHLAVKFGIDESLLAELDENIQTASVDGRLKPILEMVKKLTIKPSQIVKSDIDSILDEGWNERAVYDAIMVCSLFNFANRLVEGLGLKDHTNSTYFNV